ncbi:transposase [Marivirga tractuosa]|uniref:Transposase IS3/IS911 family protein n=1 Tax=Marivirga tractuosa (strain ATCC 23168 / DSM 4126 / NBRC 15989 / NCIMB 1408 / VKM B-1430 / H-43) TaxID=643867 RepID=E4TQP7_MARTH|nr:transposase [Marivirga tractuosa]ADR20608.1 transposase IS3/IS911 family protein [Marivirga tractuosa DSM 4126]ADR21117.1 transposase IS3/IS911 family protein [Marivirga tractuosa DSM 4126]ADR21773.1 transposase IS3/IS911 family protein [Marivirga tractuosa DSM 4126]ADR21783.1 transposase IS3/IS911 family protein [Marivirga tractuosa DSM 4126]BDD13759.1 transposase [Marivirga tractuosa]
MKAKVKLIEKYRKYSEGFKKSIVDDFESGKFSVSQLERIHKISNQSIYKWIYKYSNHNERGQRIVEMKDSSTEKLKALEQRIKELEQTVGQKQIQIDYFEKMIDVAKTELDIDIKKNSNTPQSSGSATTRRK